MNFWQHLEQPIIGLAPMDGVTDAVFRHIVARYGGPDVIFTEFTNVNELCQGQNRALQTLYYSEIERPVVAQLYGKEPEWFYRAAHIVCALGFDGLDINMGCPSKNVAASGSGAALIRTPERALAIVEAVKQGVHDWAAGQSLTDVGIKPALIQAIHHFNAQRGDTGFERRRMPIPVSIKTRLGYDTDIIEEWSACLIQGRPETITIHGRTLTQMYKGQANWESIARAAALIRKQGILVLGNGDIQSLTDAYDRIRQTGVHGILIGRAALGNPWLFQSTRAFRHAYRSRRRDGLVRPAIMMEDRCHLMLTHARLFERVNGQEAFPRMRKHLGWYCANFPHAAAMRAHMVKTKTSDEVAAILEAYRRSRHDVPSSPPSSLIRI
ncbi:MAG: tRNA-dihydrouridine synthase [Nitrospirae bacterium]|nr:MAG: tRNA-dihydrouridine synthase [Nitrospirota bacterium]